MRFPGVMVTGDQFTAAVRPASDGKTGSIVDLLRDKVRLLRNGIQLLGGDGIRIAEEDDAGSYMLLPVWRARRNDCLVA